MIEHMEDTDHSSYPQTCKPTMQQQLKCRLIANTFSLSQTSTLKVVSE